MSGESPRDPESARPDSKAGLAYSDVTLPLNRVDPLATMPHLSGVGTTSEAPENASESSTAETRVWAHNPAVSPSPNAWSARALHLGQLGDYELIDELGRGGMGVVYRARQCSLNRIVALKTTMLPTVAGDEEIARFKNEAEAAANLRHPGIVAVYEVGETEGRHYYSMEYIAGNDLSRLIREHSLPGEQAADYVRQLAEAIQYAHEQGVLHRDLKPSNVLLDSRGAIKITDFGLAKRVHSDSQLTGALTIMGTPSYMPPEQAMPTRGPVGPYSDIYSLGALLYELLTCRPPFRADNPLETIRQVVSDEPIPPRRLNPKIAVDLETICLKCLEKEPSRRYDSAQTLAEELNRYLEGQPILARPLGRIERAWRLARRHPREASLIGAIVFVVCLGAAGVFWQWRRAESNLRSAERNFELLNSAADETLAVVEEWVTRAPPQSGSQQEKLNSSLHLFEAFLREEPANLEAQERLAQTHARVAEIHRLLRQLDPATHHFREAIRIYEDLCSKSPENQAWWTGLVGAWNSLGNAEREAERYDKSGEAFESALGILRGQSTFKDSAASQAAMARTIYNRGLLRFERGEIAEARTDFEQSIEYALDSIRMEPENLKFQQELARCRINLGVLFRDTRQHQQALKQYESAIALLSRLVEQKPNENEYQAELALTHLNRGNLLLTARSELVHPEKANEEAALESLQESARLLTKLSTEYPSVPQYRIQLANALNGIGAVHQESGRSDEARDAWMKAKEEFVRVLRLSGDSAEVHSRLGLTLANLALLVPRAESGRRVPLLEEACDHQRAALVKTPESRAVRNYLRSHLIALTRARLFAHDYVKAADSAEEMAQLEIKREDWRMAAEFFVACKLNCRADTTQSQSGRDELEALYGRRAVAALRRWIELGGKPQKQLEGDQAFSELKDRADFQELLRKAIPR